MTGKSDIVARLIDEAAPRIAVVFSVATPRLIGTLAVAPSAAAVQPQVDAMLLQRNLSATYISQASCRDRLFVVAHG